MARNLTTHHPPSGFWVWDAPRGERDRRPDRIRMAQTLSIHVCQFSNHETQQRAEALVSPNVETRH